MVDKLFSNQHEEEQYIGDKEKHHQLVNQIVAYIKSEKFRSFAADIHQTVGWQTLADRLSESNKKLRADKPGKKDPKDDSEHEQTRKINIIEWYLEVTQINSEIATNLASAVASQSVELVTHIPVLKELFYLVDQAFIVTYRIGDGICSMLGGATDGMLKGLPSLDIDPKDHLGLRGFYENHIAETVGEIRDAIEAVKAKHGKADVDSSANQLSTLAAGLLITASLIKIQTRLITGLLTIPAKKLGHLYNDVVDKLEIGQLAKSLTNLVREFMERVCSLPVDLESVLLKWFHDTGNTMLKIEEVLDTPKHEHKP